MEKLARYILRASFSQGRIVYLLLESKAIYGSIYRIRGSECSGAMDITVTSVGVSGRFA